MTIWHSEQRSIRHPLIVLAMGIGLLGVGLVGCGRSSFSVTAADGQVDPVCGNGILEPSELCDNDNLNGETCVTLGAGPGTLGCTTGCTFDLDDCDATEPICGNAVLEAGEQCDRGQLDGATCESLGFMGGQLGCLEECVYNTSNCVGDVPACGDGVVGGLEDCDGLDLNGDTCQSLGFDSGTLHCGPDCVFDMSACVTLQCGNGMLDPNEQCDGALLNGESCLSLGFDGGTLSCTNGCTFDETGCFVNLCGNGLIDATEECDGNNLAGQTCQTLGFDTGTLACQANCTLDTSGCSVILCGDGLVGAGEDCDGGNLAGASCQTLGFDSGPLACTALCAYDTSDCTTATACSPTAGPLSCGSASADDTASSPFAANVMDIYNGTGCYSQWQMDGPEVVYSYAPGASDEGVMIDLTGVSADLDLIVLEEDGTGCSPNLACLEWSYNGGSSDEQVVFTAQANHTYYIVVDGFGGAQSGYNLSFSCTVVEVCDDGVDNNGDGQTDCDDPSCLGDPACWTRQIWEQFPVNTPTDTWDLDNTTVFFAPSTTDPNGYTWTITGGVSSYPTTPGTGTVDSQVIAFSSQNDSVVYALPGSYSFTFFGQTYNEIYINTHGNITFGVADTNSQESEAALTGGAPRIAGHWDTLNPTTGGTVSVDAFHNQLVITFDQVVDPFGGGATVSFQIELYWMGAMSISNQTHGGVDGIMGISEGGGATGAPEVNFY